MDEKTTESKVIKYETRKNDHQSVASEANGHDQALVL